MNLYVIAEGTTEFDVYRKWLTHLFTGHIVVENYHEATENSILVVPAGGYPISRKLYENAVTEINESGRFDWLLIAIDSDENGKAHEKFREVARSLTNALNGETLNAGLFVTAQNVCIETWFLGNLEFYPNPSLSVKDKTLAKYLDHYRPDSLDPEQMPLIPGNEGTVGDFHFQFFKSLSDGFCHNNRNQKHKKYIRYRKGKPDLACTQDFLNALQARLLATPDHLASFGAFMSFVSQVQARG